MSSDFTNDNYTWWNTTATTSDNNLFFTGTCSTTATTTGSNYTIKTPDKDWMPYDYIGYEPKWHQKFASYKNQMEHMWD